MKRTTILHRLAILVLMLATAGGIVGQPWRVAAQDPAPPRPNDVRADPASSSDAQPAPGGPVSLVPLWGGDTAAAPAQDEVSEPDIAGPSATALDRGETNGPPIAGPPAPVPAGGDDVAALDPETLRQSDWFAQVVAYIESSEYRFSSFNNGSWAAPNRAQNLRVILDPDGLQVTPRVWEEDALRDTPDGGSTIIGLPQQTREWELAIALTGLGRVGDVRPVPSPTVSADENRITYQRGPTLSEWYVNDERGLEQGFTISSPPLRLSSTPLVLALDLSGDLVPVLVDHTTIRLTAPDGVPVLRYGQLSVHDTAGRQLQASFVLHNSQLAIRVDDRNATYPITVDPLLSSWADDPADQNGAWLGIVVNTAGDVNNDNYDDIIIGASGYDNGFTDEGRVYVYHGSANGPVSALNRGPDWHTPGGGIHGDHVGYSVAAAGDVNGDGYGDVLIGAPSFDNGISVTGHAFIYFGSVIGLSEMPAWEVDGPTDNAEFGDSVAAVGDLDGDGFADVVIGAPGFSNEAPGEGGAFLYLGGPSGPGFLPDWSADPTDQPGARFGDAVAAAGDVNNDSFPDLLVSAPTLSSEAVSEGRVYLYMGTPDGLTSNPKWWVDPTDQTDAFFGASVATAGDVNCDNFADVIIGAPNWDSITNTNEGRVYLYHGGPISPGLSSVADWVADPTDQDNANFGQAVSAVDPSSCTGVLVGAPGYDDWIYTDEGRVYFYIGSGSGLTDTEYCEIDLTDQGGAKYGQFVGPAGDTDGNGVPELMVGGYYVDAQGYVPYEGYLDVYDFTIYGSSPWCAVTQKASLHPTDQDGSGFGTTAGAGDFNGDGFGDVVAGAPLYDTTVVTEEGRAYAYYGSPHGLVPPASETWYVDPTDQNGANFGSAAAAAGDINGDGFDDVIIGAPNFDTISYTNQGAAFVYYGTPTGLTWVPVWTAAPVDQDNANFGQSVGTAGDVNGDTIADVIIGVPSYSGTYTEEGRVYVYYGAFDGLDAIPPWVLDPIDESYARYGYSVSTAGDLDHDGFDDVIIGAPYKDFAGKTAQGTAYLYRGSAAGLDTHQWSILVASPQQEYANFGMRVAAAGDINGDSYDDVLVGAPYYDGAHQDMGRAFLFLGGSSAPTDPVWWASPEPQTDAYFGASLGAAGDVDGDGYDDVVAGCWEAYGYRDESGDIYDGRAYLYKGSPDGLSTSPVWRTDPTNQNDSGFGRAVATAGDVNGDGYDDVLVGAPYYDRYPNPQADEGRVYLYYGSVNGLHADVSPDWLADPRSGNYAGNGYVVDTAGDVNGDGFADVLVSAFGAGTSPCEGVIYVYHGSAYGPSPGYAPDWHGWSTASNDCFGYSAGTAGDINSDGFDDIVVGAYNYDGGKGMIYVYLGSQNGLTNTNYITRTAPSYQNAAFGYAVSAAGDVDNDGYNDIVVGAPYFSSVGILQEGRVYVLYGNATGLDASVSAADPTDADYAYFGKAVGAAGDVNGDGYDDIIVGTPDMCPTTGCTERGLAVVYQGASSGINYTPLWWGEPDLLSLSWARFGHSVNTAGDVNGDGYADIMVGVPYGSFSSVYRQGGVIVYYGSATGLPAVNSPSRIISVTHQDESYFGWSLHAAGDVNGDGYGDIIVGAPWFDAENTDEGRAYLFYGSSSGLGTDPDWFADPTEEDYSHFGLSVSYAGDVNGDGFSDIIAGAPDYDIFTDEGRAYLFYGAPEGLEIKGHSQMNPAFHENDYFGFSVASAGDVNGDGLSDVIVGAYNYVDLLEPEGRAYVFTGTAQGMSTTPDWHTEVISNPGAKLGWSVARRAM